MRAFAKHLGISATSLTDLLNDDGKWNISLKKAQPLVSKIGLSPLEENRLRVFMGDLTHAKRNPLPNSHVPLLTDWLYSAVLYAHQLPPDKDPSRVCRNALRFRKTGSPKSSRI